MSFDRRTLGAAIAVHGRVVRVVVAEVDGSAPREAGASMLVWQDGQSGTIGGGALEWEAASRARRMLHGKDTGRVERIPLGPTLGQCCGGAVTLVSEVWDAARLGALDRGAVVARPIAGSAEEPLALRRIRARARDQGQDAPTRLLHGWLVEPEARTRRHIWVWGAGHVGRAIVEVISPLPDLSLTWIDTGADRFPAANICPDARRILAADPAEVAQEAPADAEHLILTFSHVLDLELCHRLLQHGFGSVGLIGSRTKWARFRNRLTALGHSPAGIARITCPIGDPALGKHPQAIAVGVAAQLLRHQGARQQYARDGSA